MPINTVTRFGTSDHLVHFFDTDESLVSVVASYLSTAVLDGDSTVIIAAPGHCELFQAALGISGVDLQAAMGDGRLLLRDATDTLSRFTVAGRVHAEAFDRVVGGVIREAAASGRPVRAYGEMVALLWAAGDVAAAIELERLWNQLVQTVPLSLFCAYPQHLFVDLPETGAFAEVCHLHSGVVGGAPAPVYSEVTRRFARTPQAPGMARRFVSETLRSWDRDDLGDEAALVVSELVTNAILHARSDVAVGLVRLDGAVRVLVGDTSDVPPAPRGTDATALNGRGLPMIGAIGRRWGHEGVNGGKVVWVDLGESSSPDRRSGREGGRRSRPAQPPVAKS